MAVAERSNRIARTTSAEHVAAHIRRLIQSGALVTGDRVHQADIAEELGVSRIPVREALVILDREGWVSVEAHRGAFVTGLAAQDIVDHYELRGLVFGLVARRATEKATGDDIAALESLRSAMRSAVDLDSFASANERFIAALVRTAHSTRLTAALQVSPPIMSEGFFDVVPDGRRIQMDGVDAFMAALAARSVDAADHALQSMLVQQGQAVLAAYVDRGLVSADATMSIEVDG